MEGAHIIESEAESAPPVPMLGHLTSSYFSPNLNRSIALAMIKSGGQRIGQTLWVSRKDGAPIPVRVCETDFLALKERGELDPPTAPTPEELSATSSEAGVENV